MRVATYTQRTAVTRASLVAMAMLVVTILQGTSTTLTLIYHFQQSLEPLSTLLWFACYATAFVGLMLNQGITWIFWLSRYRFLLLVLMFGTAASISWSVDPAISGMRTTHLLGSTIIAIYLGFMVPLSTLLSITCWVLGFIILGSIGAAVAMPDLGIESYEGTRVWKGITTSKNTLGFWAAIAVLLYISQLPRCATLFGRLICVVMAVLSLAALYFSHSATSLVAMLLGGSIALYFYIAIRFQLGFIRMVVMAVMFAALLALVIANIDTADLVGRSGDLTGRGEVWQQTWKLILQKPLTGYGYGSIWNPNDSTIWIQEKLTDFTWVVYHAHNGFLQVASEIGLPLSAIALLMVVQQMIEVFYCQYQRQQVGVLFVLGFLVAYLLGNYSEARFLVNRELYWIFYIALPISMLRQVTVVMQEDLAEAEVDYGYPAGAGAAAAAPAGAAAVYAPGHQGAPVPEGPEAEGPVPVFRPGDPAVADLNAKTRQRQDGQSIRYEADQLDDVFARKPGDETDILDADFGEDRYDRFGSASVLDTQAQRPDDIVAGEIVDGSPFDDDADPGVEIATNIDLDTDDSSTGGR